MLAMCIIRFPTYSVCEPALSGIMGCNGGGDYCRVECYLHFQSFQEKDIPGIGNVTDFFFFLRKRSSVLSLELEISCSKNLSEERSCLMLKAHFLGTGEGWKEPATGSGWTSLSKRGLFSEQSGSRVVVMKSSRRDIS